MVFSVFFAALIGLPEDVFKKDIKSLYTFGILSQFACLAG